MHKCIPYHSRFNFIPSIVDETERIIISRLILMWCTFKITTRIFILFMRIKTIWNRLGSSYTLHLMSNFKKVKFRNQSNLTVSFEWKRFFFDADFDSNLVFEFKFKYIYFLNIKLLSAVVRISKYRNVYSFTQPVRSCGIFRACWLDDKFVKYIRVPCLLHWCR